MGFSFQGMKKQIARHTGLPLNIGNTCNRRDSNIKSLPVAENKVVTRVIIKFVGQPQDECTLYFLDLRWKECSVVQATYLRGEHYVLCVRKTFMVCNFFYIYDIYIEKHFTAPCGRGISSAAI
jgi:hypothetical protein